MDFFKAQSNGAPTNKNEVRQYKRFVAKSLRGVITPTQREYIIDYYLSNRSMKEIAEERGVNVSTVSRTIKRGMNRIKILADVYFS